MRYSVNYFRALLSRVMSIGIASIIVASQLLLLVPVPLQAIDVNIEIDTTDATDEYGPAPVSVFTDKNTGYVFFVDLGNDLAYRKTTDGGITWQTPIVIDATLTGWTIVSVWYDQWTPGNTTGTKIHIAAVDDVVGNAYYTFLDTSTDTLKGSVVTVIDQTAFTEGASGPPTVTRATDGELYLSSNFTTTAGGYVYKSTDGSGDSWSDITPASWSSVQTDQIQLLPLATDGDILALKAEVSTDTFRYRIYDGVAGTWDGSWTTVSTLVDSGAYDQWYAATLNPTTGDVHVSLNNATNTASLDIEFWTFSDTTRVWTQGGNVRTDTTGILSPVPLLETGSGDLYVAYAEAQNNVQSLVQSLGSATYVYYHKSTDNGVTWGERLGPISIEPGDNFRYLRSNFFSDERLYLIYYNDDLNDVLGSTLWVDGGVVESQIDTVILDASDEYGPAPSTVFTDTSTGYQFFVKTDSILDASDEYSPSPSTVFTSATVGYTFFIDGTSQDLVYLKTLDGGVTWSGSHIIDTALGWTNVAVWYDQWTPGDTTGTKIHISAVDDIGGDAYYTNLDTSDDSLKANIVKVIDQTTFTEADDGPPGIAKSSDGDLYLSGNFTSTAGGYVFKSTDGSGSTWSDITPASWSAAATDQIQLLPLLTDNDVLAIRANTASDLMQYRIYDGVTDTWAGAWTDIAAMVDNTTYDQWFSATLNKTTGTVYLTFTSNAANVANDVEFWSFSDGTRTFTKQTDVLSDLATVISPVPFLESDTGNVYVAYARGTLNASVQIYFKSSTDGGATWSAESTAVSVTADDHKVVRGNIMSDSVLFVTWHNDDIDRIKGNNLLSPAGYELPVNSNSLVYRKTTNGGVSWGLPYTIAVAEGTTAVAVWYDRWTPGDTTGTKIHISFSDDRTDDYYYTSFDTANDRPSSVIPVLTGTVITELGVGVPGITKGGGGALFMSGNFNTTAGGKISKSIDGGLTWSDITPASWSTVAIDQIQLLPLQQDNDIMAIRADTANNDLDYRIYDEVADTWDVAWTSIGSLTENTTYDQWFSATGNPSTGDVYVTWSNVTTSAVNDVFFWSFNDDNRTGTLGGNVITDDATVIMPVPVYNTDSGEIYVAYLRGTLADAMRVYYKSSVDGGSTWSAESQSLTQIMADDHKSIRGNYASDERLYVVWYNDDLNHIYGATVDEIVPIADLPGMPTDVQSVSGDEQVSLTWTAPVDDGGSAITDYVLEFKSTTEPSEWAIFADGVTALTSGVITGLTNGVEYYFRVSAVNSAGQGDSSVLITATPGAVPGAPTIDNVTPGDGQVTVDFSAPVSDGGSAITEYTVTSNPGSFVATGASSPITVTGLTNGVSYTFTVTATNAIGTGPPSDASDAVTPATTPSAPTAVEAVVGNGSLSLTWSAPASNGGSAITDYVVEYKLSSEPTVWSVFADGVSTLLSASVTGLTNGLSYDIRISAVNSAGQGDASTPSISATPITTPGAPDIGAATRGNASAEITFSAPVEDGGSAVLSYVVTSSPGGQTGVGASSPITVTGLTNGVSYTFTVVAVNAAGSGTSSSASNAVTPATVPGAPLNPSAVADTASAIVSFDPPASDGGSTITSYTVTSSPGDITATGASSPITVTGLSNGVAYTFTIKATNEIGEGASSEATSEITPTGLPGAPTITGVEAGDEQVIVTFTAPVSDGGSAITEYTVTSTPGSLTASGASSPITVTGLTNGVSYTFVVVATNAVGSGDPSDASSSISPLTVPDAPTGLSAEPSDSSLSLTWSAPASNGGSAITDYVVEYKLTSEPTEWSVFADGVNTNTSVALTGLTNGSSYDVRIRAVNTAGSGDASTVVTETPVAVPGAPTITDVEAGDEQVIVTFTAPVSDGGSAITEYTVTSTPGSLTASGASSPITVAGLTNGVSYTFVVVATNAVGDGPASDSSSSVVPATTPSAPINLAATIGSGSVSLTWSEPSDNGGQSVTDYVVEYQLTTGGVWAVFADGVSDVKSAIVTGLSNDNSYDFRIRAVNSVGQGEASSVVVATPGEPAQVLIQSFSDLTVPSIATSVRITNEGVLPYEYQYTWCVTDASGNVCGGGDDVFSSSAAKLIQVGENWDTSLSSTVSTPGTYWFHLSVQYGSETSTAYQSFVAAATFPDAPTIGTATAGNASATVSFSAPDMIGGSPITSYTVTSSPGGITASGATSPIVVTGLTNGVSYTFSVSATNVVGTSSSSASSNAVTPATVPGVPTNMTATAGSGQVALSWVAPVDDGGSAITDYVIEYRVVTNVGWTIFADGVSTSPTAVVTGLTNGLSYVFRVSAVNAIGSSEVEQSSASLASSTSQSGGGGGGGGVVLQNTPVSQPPVPPNEESNIDNPIVSDNDESSTDELNVPNNESSESTPDTSTPNQNVTTDQSAPIQPGIPARPGSNTTDQPETGLDISDKDNQPEVGENVEVPVATNEIVAVPVEKGVIEMAEEKLATSVVTQAAKADRAKWVLLGVSVVLGIWGLIILLRRFT